jgi:hypothetical protein
MYKIKKAKWCLIFFLNLAISLLWFHYVYAEMDKMGSLVKVPSIPPRPEWNRFKILVWQYKTSVLEDFDLYQKVGLGGFHIDRGAGREDLVAFSLKEQFPYYVDHAADKGFLHLKGTNLESVTGKRGLINRPYSLADPNTLKQIKEHLDRNIRATRKGLVLAYAFDDEISLGTYVVPCDVDNHPLSIRWFREWLQSRYREIESLNKEWNTQFHKFDEVIPIGFEEIRRRAQKPPLSKWNLAPWIDFRQFMDFQFASVLSELTRYANSLDPNTPAGFVGGQGPGPWGGYDYAKLSRAVQWMEDYNIHGTNEILRSFWNHERRPIMKTFFCVENPKLDSWFLWYYMLHGNQAVIAWPEEWFRSDGNEISPYILADKNSFEEIQGKISEPIVNPKTLFDPDPIGIYYSHPSIQVGWAMDAIVHGRNWVHRTGSIDNKNQTMGILRNVWCKVLEDLDFQYDFISYLNVEEELLKLNKKFKVIILPKTVCLSEKEAKTLKEFVYHGGVLIADYLCGIMDQHGRGREKGILDDLFGIVRDETAGYMNGVGLTEIDGEKYQKPFLDRFSYYDGAFRYKDLVVFERGTKHRLGCRGVEIRKFFGKFHQTSVIIENQFGKGRTFYLNLTPLEYWDPQRRFSNYGRNFRKIVSDMMNAAGLSPRIKIYENDRVANMIEPLYWRNGNKHYVGLIKNPTEQKELPRLGNLLEIQGITGQEVEIKLEFKGPVRGVINLRTGKNLGPGRIFFDKLKPWEGNLYEVLYSN